MEMLPSPDLAEGFMTRVMIEPNGHESRTGKEIKSNSMSIGIKDSVKIFQVTQRQSSDRQHRQAEQVRQNIPFQPPGYW
jgi:hypothetical protein